MSIEQSSAFAIEYRLKALNPELHRRFTQSVTALQYYLSRYKALFPKYTDHSELHCLSVIDYSNQLIGDQIRLLNADELYVLLMACYLHDSGMGITMEMCREFSEKINFGHYFDSHPRENYPDVVRAFHHEYSGLFIRKYAQIFDIPSEAHVQAIVQTARGHRQTNLKDEAEYPDSITMPGGNRLSLPYLAAVVRLADEIDVTASRNPLLLYDNDSLTDQKQIVLDKMLKAVRSMDVTAEAFILHVETEEEEIRAKIREMAEKIQTTLDYCRQVVRERTPYVITQQVVKTEM